jgi:hypothetical protein
MLQEEYAMTYSDDKGFGERALEHAAERVTLDPDWSNGDEQNGVPDVEAFVGGAADTALENVREAYENFDYANAPETPEPQEKPF